MTQNTVFQCVKNSFLLSQKKLIFFTILNLPISLNVCIICLNRIRIKLKHKMIDVCSGNNFKKHLCSIQINFKAKPSCFKKFSSALFWLRCSIFNSFLFNSQWFCKIFQNQFNSNPSCIRNFSNACFCSDFNGWMCGNGSINILCFGLFPSQ